MKPLKIALLTTNYLAISSEVKKGTELFVHLYCQELSRYINNKQLSIEITVYCSPDSDIPFPKKSPFPKSSTNSPNILKANYKWYEVAHIAKAFAEHNTYDLIHVHISNGEWVLPFIDFVPKPVLITMHGGDSNAYDSGMFSNVQTSSLVHYVSISDSQRKNLPHLPYKKTIYHGVDTQQLYTFSESGGSCLLWAGRAIPEKGLHTVIDVFSQTHIPTIVCPIEIPSSQNYLEETLNTKEETLKEKGSLLIHRNMKRAELAKLYQLSKAFLFPIHWEEPFGLVLAESLACGTPVIAFARGSTPEIIKDGVTGFLVNPSLSDIRGDYLVKTTGTQGLIEAAQRLMSLSHDEYTTMRRACREDAEKRFSQERMIQEYLELYDTLTQHA